MIVPVLYPSDVRLDDRHARLHQSTGQQQRLPGGVAAVAVADGVALAIEFKRLRQLAGGEDREGEETAEGNRAYRERGRVGHL